MTTVKQSLFDIYRGWDGYQQSLVSAVTPLTPQQLLFKPAVGSRSVGEVIRHITLGRIDWFGRMGAPGSKSLIDQITVWDEDPHGNRYVVEAEVVAADDPAALLHWLESTWQMIETTLTSWTVADLQRHYRHVWRGTPYDVTYQWTIWRIMAHDIHHGGELSLLLGLQGIENFELGALGGLIVEPPRAAED